VASSGVGATLREERLRRKFPLGEISRQTKISERFLTAIESDDFEALPGIIFVRNFVRQYAAALNLDPNPLLAALPSFDLETAAMPAALAGERRARWDPRWKSAVASIAWMVLAGGAAVAAYIHFNRPVHSSESAMAQTAPQAAPRSEPSTPTAAPVLRAAVVTQPPPAQDTQPVRVTITAQKESWVQVTSDGKTTFVGTMKPEESKSISAGQFVKVLTGNAGGIQIALNGKALDPLGPDGQVRSVTLTAEGPRFAPKSPPPSPAPL